MGLDSYYIDKTAATIIGTLAAEISDIAAVIPYMFTVEPTVYK